MTEFPLHTEIDSMLEGDEIALVYWTRACVAKCVARGLFNKSYEKLATAIANNAAKNAALKAAGLKTEAQSAVL